jgi:ribokinase
MSITVVGSINVDFVVKVHAMVLPGETITAQESFKFTGGKGANQALACARLGGDTSFVGKLGSDANADMALSLLSGSACKLDVTRLKNTNCGLAIILLDDQGENSIIVSPGANHVWNETDLEIVGILEHTKILVLQLEIPTDVVKRFITIAKSMNIKVVLNPSPINAEIVEFLPLIDLLLMNKTEAEYFTGETPQGTPEYAKCIRALGAAESVVTLGADGALIFQRYKISHIEAQSANVVDTTAAGDTYAGALVARTYRGDSLPSAARYASYAAGIAVSRMGAQPSIPLASEVDSIMSMG